VALAVLAASVVLTLLAVFAPGYLAPLTASLGRWQNLGTFALLGSIGALLYGVVLLASLRGLGVRLARR
jgi:hypothetical protein